MHEADSPDRGSDTTVEEAPTPAEKREHRRTRLLGLGLGLLSIGASLVLRAVGVQRHLASLPILLAGIYIYFRIAPKLPEYRPHFEALTVDAPDRNRLSSLPLIAFAIVLPAAITILLRKGDSHLSIQDQGILLATAILPLWGVARAVKQRYGHESQLWRAAMNGNHREVRRLLAAGASPNELDPNGNPVLVWPVLNADRKLLTLLLEAGARPDVIVHARRQGQSVRVSPRELALRNPLAVPKSDRRSDYLEIARILEEDQKSGRLRGHPPDAGLDPAG